MARRVGRFTLAHWPEAHECGRSERQLQFAGTRYWSLAWQTRHGFPVFAFLMRNDKGRALGRWCPDES